MNFNSSTHIVLLFVFLWSSAYIAFEFCSPHIEPATFVVVRTGATAACVYLINIVMGFRWPGDWLDIVPSIVVGILIHGFYAGGLFASIYHGIDITLCALILCLQPMITVLLSCVFLREKITARSVIGIMVSFVGVSIMILEGGSSTIQVATLDDDTHNSNYQLTAIALCFAALLAISCATIIQKRFVNNIELMPGAFIQFSSAMYFMIPFAIAFETMQINWNPEFSLSLAWLVIVVSIGAMTLLMTLIQHDSASIVANFFYLVTPVVAIESWILFGEKLSITSFIGMITCMLGVFVVNYSSTVNLSLTSKNALFKYKNPKRLAGNG